MAPKPAAGQPNLQNYLRMLTGRRIHIHVGPQQKHFCLSEELLCHYSGYITRCVDSHYAHHIENCQSSRSRDVDTGADREAIHLTLLEDNPDDFAIMVDYIYRGTVVTSFAKMNETQTLSRCMRFIDFVDTLEMGEVASAIYPVLKRVLNGDGTRNPRLSTGLEPEHVELIFGCVPPGNNVRTLVVQAALSETMKTAGGKFAAQIRRLDEFAAETWREVQKAGASMHVVLPLENSRCERSFP